MTGKDEEELDKNHASDIYLKLFGALYLRGALAQPVDGLKLKTPFAGFERVKPVAVED
jgi:cytochrome c oxidase subunit IV